MRPRFSRVPRSEESAKRSPKGTAWDAAWRLLAIRLRTRHELKERLTAKGYSADDVSSCLTRLTEAGWVNDRTIATFWAGAKADRRHLGRRRVIQALRDQGVPRDIVEEVLGQVDAESEEARALAAARLVWKRVSRLPRDVSRRRLYGALGRKGFESSLIMKVTRRLVGEDERD